MAPQVGFEPTTLRLTAECSKGRLLREKNLQEGFYTVLSLSDKHFSRFITQFIAELVILNVKYDSYFVSLV